MDKNQITETVMKSALSLIPGVGGALATILGDYLSVRKEERLNNFINEYFNEMNQKKQFIVSDYIRTEDFLDIFENILSDIMHTRTDAKRNMLKNLLVNSCTIPSTPYERTEEFKHLIDVLSPMSFIVLSVFYNLRTTYMDGNSQTIDLYFNEIKKVTGINNHVLLLDYITELESRALVDSFRNNAINLENGIVITGEKPYISAKGIMFYNYITCKEDGVPDNSVIFSSTPKGNLRTEELENFINEHTVTEDDIKAIFNQELGEVSKISYGTDAPDDLKEGEIYFQIE